MGNNCLEKLTSPNYKKMYIYHNNIDGKLLKMWSKTKQAINQSIYCVYPVKMQLLKFVENGRKTKNNQLNSL